MQEEETTKVPEPGRRGRGALSNASGRFEAAARSSVDDGWGTAAMAPAPLRTTLTEDRSRSIIARNNSPDIGFDRSINPYRGCEHGCVYCFARPTHAWLGLSAGLDFESRLFYKPEAARLLEKELARPHYRPAPIAMGTNTDPYQPAEQRLEITRAILQVLARFEHPLSITTKSESIVRDIDILAPMAARGLVEVALSVTTLDRGLARRMEPRAATPGRRLAALRRLARAGIPTAVMVAPVIPAINDGEIEAILEAAAEAGAGGAGYILLRLPLEIRQLWAEWLAEHYPDRAEKVMGLMRGMRGGRDYDPTFGRRMTGQGPYARLIGRRFRLAAKRLGLASEGAALDCSRFRPPPRPGEQLRLL
jgi:DNA repair photolyase